MNGADLQLVPLIVVEHGEKAELAHQAGRQELRDEALVLEITHGEIEGFPPV
ncbi:hypothetical protein SDC9_134539 [bioreactor metagenome]|uniref:Uncharacterized protein n=1 Tax=bioreactor metagenome TaxID=1076179 RepID=A0A645DF21_9ZZZZ